jgi:hypothetical protein
MTRATTLAAKLLCTALTLLTLTWPQSTAAQPPPAAAESGSLAEWQARIAAAPPARKADVMRRFTGVRRQLLRDERVPQVLRFAVSSETFNATCAAEEASGTPLGIDVWKATEQQVVAAVPPASRRRLLRTGLTGDVLFKSVADWQRARDAGSPTARRIEPVYNDPDPSVIVFDLSNSTLAPGTLSRGLLDRESVMARNASYLAYLEVLPEDETQRPVLRRYTNRGLAVAAVFPLAEFRQAAARFFPELGAAQPEGAAAGTEQEGPPYDGEFHTYEEVEAEFHDLAERFPDIARVESLGPTYEGRELWALKVSSNVDTEDTAKPDVLFTGCLLRPPADGELRHRRRGARSGRRCRDLAGADRQPGRPDVEPECPERFDRTCPDVAQERATHPQRVRHSARRGLEPQLPVHVSPPRRSPLSRVR